jgi:release factor glutamine methyltransferase
LKADPSTAARDDRIGDTPRDSVDDRAWQPAVKIRDAMTTSELVAEAAATLHGAGIEQPRLEARWLLGHVLSVSQSSLLAHPEQVVSPVEAGRFRDAIRRRAAREPFAYVVGEREFWGDSFVVDRRVLVPRDDSEVLILEALELRRRLTSAHAEQRIVVDVGTGSGALACVLAREMSAATVIGCDVSADALAVAAANRERLGLQTRLHLVRGHLLAWLQRPADLVVANLPYLPSARILTLMPEVSEWEPRLALDGGADGLDLIRELLQDAPRVVKPGGTILLELDPEQIEPARALLPGATSSVVSFDGLERVLRLDLP